MSDTIEKEISDLLKAENYDKAFRLIVSHFKKRIYWHCRRMLLCHENANDVSQNIFIKVWKALPNFKGDSKIYTWLYRITNNECITFLNSQKIKFIEGSSEYLEHLSNTLISDDHYDGDEIQIKLQLAVASLPPKQQSVFNMKYFENMKYDDIAEITGSSIGSLKASYHHAVKKIEDFIKEY